MSNEKIVLKKNIPKLSFPLLFSQIVIVGLAGIFGKDIWYSILISIIGVIFNMLVSYNVSYGFLFGFVYAVANGIMAYHTKIYATFGFMIFMQAPVALYSFIVWNKNKGKDGTILKNFNAVKGVMLCLFMILIGFGSFFLLKTLKSQNLIPDAIFFVFSVTACILLALRYKIAYVVVLCSGLGGTVLWGFQALSNNVGISVAVFYAIVAINSIIGVIKNYKSKSYSDKILQTKNS